MLVVLKQFVIVLFLFVGSFSAQAQPNAFDITAIDSLVAKGNKDVFIFMYTGWCRYCAAMKQTTFKNDSVVQLLNHNFYFVPFDAETKKDIKFKGNIYQYIPSGAETGLHQLVQVLSGASTPAYPFMAVLNKEGQVTFSYNSYLNAKDLVVILHQLLQHRTSFKLQQ